MRIENNMTLFWRTGEVFSNWYRSDFEVSGMKFNCGEQWMMYSKAVLFGDVETAAAILKERVPRNQKALGRKVRNFSTEVWSERSEDLMCVGLLEKFRQDEALRKAILETGDTLLVEASLDDNIWGIGLEESDPRALDQEQWQGQNKLGNVLMKVRAALRKQGSVSTSD